MFIGAGMLADKFHEMGRELGYSMGQANGFKSQMLIAGILGEESADAVRDLGAELGNVNKVSNAMAADVAMLAYNYKLSGEQAAYLSTAFGELQGKSFETGENTLKYVEALSVANGVIPSKAMKDIADNSEFMAKFTKDGGKNIADAAISAAKLGVGLKVSEQIADHLLDYQTSVNDEMEASVLLGRNLNLSKARELMYNGKIGEGMQSALEAAGGIEEFNKMDYYQRQAVAKALGVQVSELQKMAAHEEELNGVRGVGAQIYSTTGELTKTISETIGGKMLGAIGGSIIGAGHLLHSFHMMGFDTSWIAKTLTGWGSSLKNGLVSLWNWITGLKAARAAAAASNEMAVVSNMMPVTPIASSKRPGFLKGKKNVTPQPTAITPTTAAPTTLTPPTSTAGPQQSMLSKFGSATQIAALAVVLIAFAAAIFILSKAFENFDKLKNVGQTLGVFTAAIIGMGVSIGVLATILAPLQPVILPLVAAMLGFGAAIALVGVGINLAATGMATLVTAFSSLGSTAALNMLAFGASLYMVAGGLAAMATAGTLALPILAAVTAVGAIVGGTALALGGGKNENTSDKLLEEIVGLRSDLNSGKVAVFIDGKKVSTNLAISERRQK